MSTSKKPLRKRKRQSPSHVGRRLEKLRCGQRSLWDDVIDNDDNANNYNNEENIPTKPKSTSEQTYIVLTDSDEEKSSSRIQTKPSKSRKKLLKSLDENVSSDNDHKTTTTTTTKCPTCLICSILTTLSSYNCCAKHLDLLVHKKISQQQTSQEQWPPQQVMILPMTDELLQRYLSSQEIYQLKPKNSPASTNKRTTVRKLSKKTTSTTSEISDVEPAGKPIEASPDPLSMPNSGAAPSDATFTVITSSSTTLNSFESPSMLDTCQLQQSSDQPIVIDDSQSDTSTTTTTTANKQKDPWVPISDETYEAIENALSQQQTTTVSQEQIVFPPAIARRMPTELMASRLPRIQLKQGRYRYGKPVAEKNTADSTTTNESRSNEISQSATVSSSTSTSLVNFSSTRPISSLATIVEDESLVIQSTRPLTEKMSQITNTASFERQDNTPEGLSDTVMSCLFAQDELSQQDNIQLTGKSVSNEVLVLPPPPVPDQAEEPVQIQIQVDESQSSQLTNDQSDTQPIISSTTTIASASDKLNATPSRISYRRNPDGSLVSISRPRLSANPQTPTSVLRRKSTDVTTPSTSQAK